MEPWRLTSYMTDTVEAPKALDTESLLVGGMALIGVCGFFLGKIRSKACDIHQVSVLKPLLVGMIRGMGEFSMNSYILLIGASNLFSITLGGVISGLSVPRESLVRHLLAVGLLVWLFGLVNVALGIIDFTGFIFSSVIVAACVALGGWISGLFANSRA